MDILKASYSGAFSILSSCRVCKIRFWGFYVLMMWYNLYIPVGVIKRLFLDGRSDEVQRVMTDVKWRQKLYDEYELEQVI